MSTHNTHAAGTGWMVERLEELKQEKLYRKPVVLETGQSPYIRIGNRELLMLSSNNYLGLSEHPEVKRGTCDAVETYGTGSGGSRLTTGTNELYQELEARLAEFKGCDACLVFSTGYMANLSVLTSLTGKGDVIFSDELNHASIIDGCRLSRAEVRVYRHRDTEHLRELLTDAGSNRRRLIVTDSVFSMDGDLAPLREIVELAEEFDAYVMVDEAHATGIFGQGRSGVAEHFHVHERIDVHMGTLSKALGSLGGYVAGRSELIEYLLNTARPFIFTTALPPAAIGAALAALSVIQREDPAEKLWCNLDEYTARLRRGGVRVESESQITPILTGDADVTCAVSKRLFERGVYAAAIRPPAVPTGRIRTSLMATHSGEDIKRATDIILETLIEHGLI